MRRFYGPLTLMVLERKGAGFWAEYGLTDCVNKCVVIPAAHDHRVERGLATTGPMLHMMSVQIVLVCAAW